jgi:hypothetical protein
MAVNNKEELAQLFSQLFDATDTYNLALDGCMTNKCKLCMDCDLCGPESEFVRSGERVQALKSAIENLEWQAMYAQALDAPIHELEEQEVEVKEAAEPPQEPRLRICVGNKEGEFHTDDLPVNGGIIEANGDDYTVQYLNGVLYLTSQEDRVFKLQGLGWHLVNFAAAGDPDDVFIVYADHAVQTPVIEELPLSDIGSHWTDMKKQLTGLVFLEDQFMSADFRISSGEQMHAFELFLDLQYNGKEVRLVDPDENTCFTFPGFGRHIFRAKNEDGEVVTFGFVVVEDLEQPVIEAEDCDMAAQGNKRQREDSDDEQPSKRQCR